MVIADKFRIELEKTRKELMKNFDKKDFKFITLYEELKRLFKEKNIEEFTSEEINQAVSDLKEIYESAHMLNTKNSQLSNKYENDYKFAKIHKRLKESKLEIFKSDIFLHDILLKIKHSTDIKVLDNHDIINNKDFFSNVTNRTILSVLEEKSIKNLKVGHFINNILVNEYLEEMVA